MTSWKSFVLPGVTLGVWTLAIIARTSRTSMIEVLNQDHVRTARAMGLSEGTVILKYALVNASIPIVTITLLRLGLMLVGAVYAEQVFAWPGIAKFLVDSINSRNVPVIQGSVLLLGLTFVFLNLAADVLIALIDPRIRHRIENEGLA
jgi:ABC-type dipeptide/oligopeptide/nickel transport system permease component